ncbi:MAG: PAS domain-containing protein [Acidipila sp.]|nr:PAS domain-containing protein [Acidipila sp.]
MRLRLKTKITLTTALLVLTMAALVSGAYVARLVRQSIHQLDERAHFLARQVLLQAQNAFIEAAERGEAPSSSSPDDVHEYVRRILETDGGLTALLQGAVVYDRTVYEVTITDRAGVAMVSTDPSLPGKMILPRAMLDTFSQFYFIEQMRRLYGPPRVYEYTLAFNLGDQPYGDIRVDLNSVLLRDQITPALRSAIILALMAVVLSTLIAGLATSVALEPLQKISAQLDRIAIGEFDSQPLRSGDELGQVSTKISAIGHQLRDVREIFSTLRANLGDLTSGLDDGLLLFSSDGQAVFVSPSMEKFLQRKPEMLVGRTIQEIFDPETPLGQALHAKTDWLRPVESLEVTIEGPEGPLHLAASVRVIAEGGARMGALVSLRDLDSIERIGSQLAVSERLAALGRVTAGVAHEVKNPLNSMRLWLENLRESLPGDPVAAQDAVNILDKEIDRLDRVVKTFLDFTRPVEMHLQETDLPALVGEVVALSMPQIKRAKVQVEIEQSPQPVMARVDRELMKQALLNLILNACDAMSAGGKLTLSIRRRGEVALLSISDNGHGIAPENHRKIFELFFSTRPGGSGLGLATTFRIVQLHSGSIDFQSEIGRGTSFFLELPLA